ncbi:MAG: ribose 5-phosphate isomerase B [Deltaproteobacteria bacterium]|mgnify:CR=1 FL=1|jgi:ribose 5-phosphate isomerase B|nr:MAG: ribose 5-phosphate isomerase B [Deltaproteobacteria bacterium]
MVRKKLALASDHAGVELKEEIKKFLLELGYLFDDFGVEGSTSVDYPDYASIVAEKVSSGEYEGGILFCGSGVGMAIVANKFPGVRAVQVNDVYTAIMSRKHNDTNVLALAGRTTAKELAKEIVRVWLETPFEGGRHTRRLKKIEEIEKRIYNSKRNL